MYVCLSIYLSIYLIHTYIYIYIHGHVHIHIISCYMVCKYIFCMYTKAQWKHRRSWFQWSRSSPPLVESSVKGLKFWTVWTPRNFGGPKLGAMAARSPVPVSDTLQAAAWLCCDVTWGNQPWRIMVWVSRESTVVACTDSPSTIRKPNGILTRNSQFLLNGHMNPCGSTASCIYIYTCICICIYIYTCR